MFFGGFVLRAVSLEVEVLRRFFGTLQQQAARQRFARQPFFRAFDAGFRTVDSGVLDQVLVELRGVLHGTPE